MLNTEIFGLCNYVGFLQSGLILLLNTIMPFTTNQILYINLMIWQIVYVQFNFAFALHSILSYLIISLNFYVTICEVTHLALCLYVLLRYGRHGTATQ